MREDLERLGHGARVIEAIFRLTAERDPQPAAFALLTRALRALEGERPARVQLAFALRFLDLTGHRPRLDRCAGCGRAVGTEGVAFDAGEGGVRCAGCRGAGLDGSSRPGRSARSGGSRRPPGRPGSKPGIPAPVEAEAASVLDGYLAALSGSALRTPRFLARTLGPPELRVAHALGGRHGLPNRHG